MSHNEYKYTEATVRFYDVLYDQFTGVLRGGKERTDFYLGEIARTDNAILEAGVGTGMIFVHALQNGADIYGIDNSELMYNKVRSKLDMNEQHRITLQDIRDFKLEQKFGLIISPFRVFQHLLTIDDQLKALDSIYNHLEDGGRLIFDLFCPDLTRLHSEINEMLEYEGEYEKGKYLRRYFSVKPDYINQTQHITFKYVWDEDGEKSSEYYFPMRYYFRFEIENLIARTKFKLDNIYGDFKKGKLSNKSNEFVVVCSK